MKASDIMTEAVVTIRGSASVARAVKLMQDKHLHALIVERRHDEDAYGIITETDIIHKVIAFGKDPKQIRVYEIMTKPCTVVNPDLGVEYVARLFADNGIRVAPVIQEKLLGIVSATDILTKSDFVERPQSVLLEQKIEAAIANARKLCAREGVTARDCITAWSLVDDLEAEAAHQRTEPLAKTAFEEYCEEYPELLSKWEYDAWCSG
ncbi:MAG: CBS domain-containing protein [Cyanothece sp. SIO1E1]|nr:CBS domain-containing protein [Cyanothece sp. SIO1E1]